MTRLCETCGRYFDDEQSWTLCPHGPLWAPLNAYCREHDLVNCKLHGEPHEYAQLARASETVPSDRTMFQASNRRDLSGVLWDAEHWIMARLGFDWSVQDGYNRDVTTWCGSRIELRGRFWQWLVGWIRGGWRPSAFRMRRDQREIERVSKKLHAEEANWPSEQCDNVAPEGSLAWGNRCILKSYHVGAHVYGTPKYERGHHAPEAKV